MLGSSDAVHIEHRPTTNIGLFHDLLATHSYTLFFADVPGGSSHITCCWNAIAKAVAICSDIGIHALICGFRGCYWYHLFSRSLLELQAMLATQHHWYTFDLVTLYRGDHTSTTDSLHILYHNKRLDIQHTPCSCTLGTPRIRFEVRLL